MSEVIPQSENLCRVEPATMGPTIHQLNDQAIADARDIMERASDCLKRWQARYAASEHAQKHCKETRLLMQEIGEWLLRL